MNTKINEPIGARRPAAKKAVSSENQTNPFDMLKTDKHLFTGLELFEMKIEKYPTLWGKVLPARGVGVIMGASDTGKSMFCKNFSLSIAKGEKTFLGMPLYTRHKRVLIVSTEEEEMIVSYILNQQRKLFPDPEFLNNIKFLFNCRDYLKEASEVLKNEKFDLIVLDSWGDISRGHPNDYSSVRQQGMQPWKELALKHNCLVLIIHHTVKNSEHSAPDKNKLNGSQAMEAMARCVIQIQVIPRTNRRTLTIVKCNHLPEETKGKSMEIEVINETRTLKFIRHINRDSLHAPAAAKFDKNIWIQRCQSKRADNMSFDKIREEMLKNYPGEEVPSVTWFKENYKEPEVNKITSQQTSTRNVHWKSLPGDQKLDQSSEHSLEKGKLS